MRKILLRIIVFGLFFTVVAIWGVACGNGGTQIDVKPTPTAKPLQVTPLSNAFLLEKDSVVSGNLQCADGNSIEYTHKLLWYDPEYLFQNGLSSVKLGSIIFGQCNVPYLHLALQFGYSNLKPVETVPMYKVIATLSDGKGLILLPYPGVKIE
jgi:hypothetical protein